MARLAAAVVGRRVAAGPGRRRRAAVTRPAGVAEEIAGLASLLRWFTRRWPGAGGITSDDADRLESLAAEAVGRALANEITSNRYGQCETCGKPAIPGRPQCDALLPGRAVLQVQAGLAIGGRAAPA